MFKHSPYIIMTKFKGHGSRASAEKFPGGGEEQRKKSRKIAKNIEK